MLKLKNVKKTYTVGNIETQALKDISLSFREKEFVAILGASGSGKTTLLNIIGGLDRYDSGDLIIKGRSTKQFRESDWDAYRNNSVGFVFQSYNLITHLSIVANVELGMTLSGVPAKIKHQKAVEVLEKVGLKEHLHKKPNQLSGGQMQRVAIARALVNDPEILLCDEPTGALDTVTSVQILELIKEVAEDRLVIMVTHNPELAEDYASRIISFKDGDIISDTKPVEEEKTTENFNLKKTGMKFRTALGLSFNNLRTKKWRTALTCFASSIGIIGIAIILSLSTGFQTQIESYQSDAMAEFPIMISQSAMNMDKEKMEEMHNEMQSIVLGDDDETVYENLQLFDAQTSQAIHYNDLNEDYLDYIADVDSEYTKAIGYAYFVGLNLFRETDDGVIPVSMPVGMSGTVTPGNVSAMSSSGMTSYPKMLDENAESYMETNYDILYGEYPSEITDLVLTVDAKNRIDCNLLKNMGFDVFDEDGEMLETFEYEDVVGTKIKLVYNDDYYVDNGFGGLMPNVDFESVYENENNLELEIVGVAKPKADVGIAILGSTFVYSDELIEKVLETEVDSKIVELQNESDFNVLSMEPVDAETKAQMVSYFGGSASPAMIMLYPKTFESKENILEYLDDYNTGVEDEKDMVIYTDLAATMTDMTSGIMDAITIVLIAFAAISLVVSLIMICIITYTSVLERTKEIGILKSLGARRKDICRVFDAETCILGVFSGLLGIGIAYGLSFPINNILYNLTKLEDVANLNPVHAFALVAISTALTMIGGHIPAIIASKKNAVDALRSE